MTLVQKLHVGYQRDHDGGGLCTNAWLGRRHRPIAAPGTPYGDTLLDTSWGTDGFSDAVVVGVDSSLPMQGR